MLHPYQCGCRLVCHHVWRCECVLLWLTPGRLRSERTSAATQSTVYIWKCQRCVWALVPSYLMKCCVSLSTPSEDSYTERESIVIFKNKDPFSLRGARVPLNSRYDCAEYEQAFYFNEVRAELNGDSMMHRIGPLKLSQTSLLCLLTPTSLCTFSTSAALIFWRIRIRAITLCGGHACSPDRWVERCLFPPFALTLVS